MTLHEHNDLLHETTDATVDAIEKLFRSNKSNAPLAYSVARRLPPDKQQAVATRAYGSTAFVPKINSKRKYELHVVVVAVKVQNERR